MGTPKENVGERAQGRAVQSPQAVKETEGSDEVGKKNRSMFSCNGNRRRLFKESGVMRTGAGKSRIKNEKSNWIDEKIVPGITILGEWLGTETKLKYESVKKF